MPVFCATVSVVEEVESISDEKETRVGPGHFLTMVARYRRQTGELVALQDGRHALGQQEVSEQAGDEQVLTEELLEQICGPARRKTVSARKRGKIDENR